MAAAQPGTSSSAQASDNRIYLFRLQILIIDGGLTVLRNYVDQILTAKSMTLSACLAKENTTITRLRGRGTITKAQYALLFPSGGNISTSDLDITLIICLLRNLKCFGLNSKFNWNTQPGQNDLSIEADMYRLKSYRNEMCHISTTTGIQQNGFKTMWKDIKKILLRVNSSSGKPLTDLKQKITDYKSSPLDAEAEERMKNEIKKWTHYEKAVEVKLELVTKEVKEVKDILGTQTKRQAQTHKRTLKNAKDVKITKSKIAKLEKQMPAGNKITRLNEYLVVNDPAVNEERYQQLKTGNIFFHLTNINTNLCPLHS
ncbi:uncharacterized protein LOC132714402 [Ruditapes philippinarum]|uniref:uncharacterized protein LOC132714402 n=1 Tax=Ruditapes philippinarum TaxID=129788 RepID=UPI00295AEC2C|nr:uncharacterized protein LOC132714402 [Ruditapes philippinarum]